MGSEIAAESLDQKELWVGLARAFAGALIFSLPMLMTMEMWWLGFYMNQYRLALFIAVNVLLLIGLARYRGFKHSLGWFDTVVDAFVGYLVGFVTSALFLPLLGVIEFGMGLDEIVGKISIQAVPASIGALLARSQIGEEERGTPESKNYTSRYLYELFIMLTGALFIAFNLAPTEEMILIAYKITPQISLMMVVVSIIVIHAFVYSVGFRGQEEMPEKRNTARLFFGYAIVGYAVVLLASLYILWTFGRLDGNSLHITVLSMTVLSVPGAVGAASARLII